MEKKVPLLKVQTRMGSPNNPPFYMLWHLLFVKYLEYGERPTTPSQRVYSPRGTCGN